jgi:DNA-binding transcriptional LysR family regulator
LADEGSFTSAARKLHIVQSGLSVTIKEMEEELGVRLVQRTTRRVSLKDAGTLFLEYARPAVTMLSDGIEAVRSQNDVVRGRISLGILQSLGPYIDIPTVLGRFHAQYPDVDFTVRSIDSPQAPELIKEGSIDLCFDAVTAKTLPSGVDAIPFVQDSLVAICAKKHPLAQRKAVTLEVMCPLPFVDLTPESIRGLEKRCGTSVTCADHAKCFRDGGGYNASKGIGALERSERAVAETRKQRENPSGPIRLIIPRTATKAVILPKLAQFARSYPEIVLEVTSSNDPVDLVAGEYDAGVQLGEFIQRDMIAVRVTKELRLAVVGTPEYFESNSIPRHPQDLKDHSCIGFRFSNGLYRWEFERGRKSLTVSPQGLHPSTIQTSSSRRCWMG